MKVLVSAASKYGATAGIAEAIGKELAATGAAVTVLRAEDVRSVDEYDACVIGSGVYAGHWLKPARELVDAHATALRERQVWLFSSGPLGSPALPKTHAVDIAPTVRKTRARGHRLFAGALYKRRLSFVERAVANAFRTPEGDFRDWEAIAAWAREIAGELAKSAQPATATARA